MRIVTPITPSSSQNFPVSTLNNSVMSEIVLVRKTEFSDFEALHDAALDGPSEVVQLAQGKMSGALMHLSVGSIGISTGSFSLSVRGRGVLSERRWLFTFFAKPARMQHFEVAPGNIVLLAPGREHFSSYSSANDYTSVFVEPGELLAFIASQPGARDAAVWREPDSLLTGASSARAAADVSTLIAALRDTALSEDAADFYKRNILQMLTAPALDNVPYRGMQLQQQSRLQLVHDVERYLVAAGNRPIHISELSEVFKVNPRRLHRAFMDVLGIPPITFLRRKRLGAVHAALLTGSPGMMVKAVAIEHGFLELGRFAGEYRKLFGEKPSETLRRTQHR
jgi:AraC-like DNA-binding protein